MRKIWIYISFLGTDGSQKTHSDRNTILVNRMNFIMFNILLFLNIATAVLRIKYQAEYSIHTKKLLIMLIFNTLNFGFSYYGYHKITKIILIFIPSIVLMFLPISLGSIQSLDYVLYPLSIIGLSFIPQLILKPDLSNKLYLISVFYFFLQAVFFNHLLDYFSNSYSAFNQLLDDFIIYYKLGFISIFLFIQTTMFYLRNLNFKYETELHEHNEELKSTIEKLNETRLQLVQSEKMASLGILTAGVAHEINNPLNFINGGIIGLESYLKKNLNEHIQKVEPLINAIHVGVKRTADIVTSLGHYSRQDNQAKTNCDIHSIIDNCLTMLHNQLKNKAEIIKKYSNQSYILAGNEGKLHQALLNIISNAGQAIENKGVIKISTQIIDSKLLISIQDNGCGIRNENMGKIFDPFFTTKDPGKGTGLGLSISYNIIQEHGGTIEFKSELNKGTIVIISLPINNNIK